MEEAQPTAHPVAPLTVLIVDDNADAADSLALLLKLWGYEGRVAYDGSTALAAFQQQGPDAVFLDLSLPGLDGFAVAGRLRTLAQGRGFTLIALTGLGREEDHRRAAEAGFDLHLLKPVDPEHLHGLLAALAQKKAEGQLSGGAEG
jgi:CheY-like chemotaxis protein